MKIYTEIVYQMNDDGTFTTLSEESYDYEGPVAQCFGGRSSTEQSTSTVQDIDTTSVGIESVEGIGIASAGDVNFNQDITQTDFGAIGSAFEFAGEFGEDAFDFASDVGKQATETTSRALDISRQAVSTVATGGASDLAGINARTIGFIVAGLAAIFIVPALLKRSA